MTIPTGQRSACYRSPARLGRVSTVTSHGIPRSSRIKASARVPLQQAAASRADRVVARGAKNTTLTKGASVCDAPGTAEPLGPSPTAKGVNFAVFSAHATEMSLCLFTKDNEPITELSMTKSGDVFHVEAVGCPRVGVLYGVRVKGNGGWETGNRWQPEKVVLDPYSPLIAGRARFGQRDEVEQFKQKEGSVFRGTFDFEAKPYDWGADYKQPNLHQKDLVIYECSVRSFTASATSGLDEDKRGTFSGVAAKVEHLKKLGVNAIELLPVFEYDELEFQRDSNPRDHMVNIWGYSHMNFFSPMSRFGTGGLGPANAAREFKDMVRTLHAAGIEVILDVVYNHTVEGADNDPYVLSHRAVDAATYYQMNLNEYVQLLNYSGCGNTVAANNPATARQIIDSLRVWVEEYHVDGFRFDLATALCRDAQGNLMPVPPLIREIAKDPVLNKTKLIAEPWDIGSYQVGKFPNWDVWSEWNGQYRDVIRGFVKGDEGMKPALATRLAGSADLYHNHNRKPWHGINFVIAHDGFTLHDLVAYNEKHNGANGENNNDGSNDNVSWNCGVEGDTDNPAVLALRNRQMRNMHLALMMSQGTPMVLMGDEYAQTRYGNNNWYGHDNDMTRFNWDALESQRDGFFRFYASLIKFRIANPLLGRAEFLAPEDITWHEQDWDNASSKFLAFTLHDRGQGCGDLLCAFNAHHVSIGFDLPAAPDGHKWCRLVDTNLPCPRDWTEGGNNGVDKHYGLEAHSSILLISKPV